MKQLFNGDPIKNMIYKSGVEEYKIEDHEAFEKFVDHAVDHQANMYGLELNEKGFFIVCHNKGGDVEFKSFNQFKDTNE